MTSPGDSLLGKAFDGYRIEKPLGAGGMATVYRALDVKLKRYVAIKVIGRESGDDPDSVQRFEREAQSIARLEHANIVRVYRFGEIDGRYYLAMQYVDGADLGTLIRDYRAHGEVMPIGDIVRVVRDIGAALDFSHSRDVIHRDVKPGNIMVDQEGRALLTDFGLALMGDVGTRGEVLGTPQYISPEQLVSSANAVPQSDLYSLGATLFAMLTGEAPFAGDDLLAVTVRVASEPAPPPSRFNAALPASIDEVVLRALEKDPYERYASGAALSAALDAAVARWTVSDSPLAGPVRRPSLVLLQHKIRGQLHDAATPAATAPSPTRVSAPNEANAALTPTHQSPEAPRANRWRGPLVFALVVFLIGALAILARRPHGDTAATQSTQLADIGGSPSVSETSATPAMQPTVRSAATPIGFVLVQPTQTNFSLPVVPPTGTIPASVPTLVPTTPIPIVRASATPRPSYALLIARQREDSLFVINRSSAAMPLAPLRLGDRGGIDGMEWGLDELGAGQCVAAWKDSGNPRAPNVTCTEVGERITRDGPNRFWKSSFHIYYDERLVGTCDANTCSITVQD